MKKRIHLVHYSSEPGGIEVLIPVFSRALLYYSYNAFVIRPPRFGQPNIYENSSVTVEYGSKSRLYVFFQFVAYAFKNNKDIFHVFNIGPVYLFLLKLAGCNKVVYGIHGTVYWKNKWQRWYLKLVWKAALSQRQRFTSNSLFSARMFHERISSKIKITLLYNPINNKIFFLAKENINSVNKPMTIIYSGRLAKGKNLFTWLDIATVLSKKDLYIRFDIYGNGPLKNQLIDYTEKQGISRLVTFKGHVEDIASAYGNADLLLFLSEYESFGNVVVESILCGTPIIASSIPSMQEIFQNYPDFLVNLDANIEQNVIEKIDRLHELKAQLPKVMKEFESRFSLQQHTEKLNMIYNSF